MIGIAVNIMAFFFLVTVVVWIVTFLLAGISYLMERKS